MSQRGPTVPAANVEEMIAANPIGSADLRLTPLWETEGHTAQLVQLRGRMKTHYHEFRDEVILVVRGSAIMRTGGAEFRVIAGDCFTIPRRTVHAVIADDYCAVVSIFTPKFDDKDRVFIEDR